MKALSRAPLAAGAIVLCGVLVSVEASAASPGTIPPGNPRTLDLTAVPMTIDASGTYVVRHNWDLGSSAAPPSGFSTPAITITASNVVIDFQGYQIKWSHTGMGLKIAGNDVTLRNGALQGGVSNPSWAMRSSGQRTEIDNMSIYSSEGMYLLGPYAHVHDSDLYARGGTVAVGNNAVVERNVIRCNAGCVTLAHDGRVEHNRILPSVDFVVVVNGSRNALIDNVVEAPGNGYTYVFGVTGNGNKLLRNTVMVAEVYGPVIDINGTGNTIDANVAPPIEGHGPSGIGVRFKQGGNFYGNNRVWAATSYDVGGLPQTDWGGNVAY